MREMRAGRGKTQLLKKKSALSKYERGINWLGLFAILKQEKREEREDEGSREQYLTL